MSVRTTNWDAVIAGAALDKTASVVRDGSGEHWEPSGSTACPHWTAPPPLGVRPQDAPDLTGVRLGRLTVVGYLDRSKSGGNRWLVRCTCGDYEPRRAKVILRPGPSEVEPMCHPCNRLENIKRGERAIRTGKYSDGRRCEVVGLKTSDGQRRLKDTEAA